MKNKNLNKITGEIKITEVEIKIEENTNKQAEEVAKIKEVIKRMKLDNLKK